MNYLNEKNGYSIKIVAQNSIFPQNGGIITINDKLISEWIKEYYITNINGNRRIRTALIEESFKFILDIVFLAIRDLETNNKDYISANHIADFFFNNFRPIWQTHINFFKSFEEIDLWNELLKAVNEWEKNNNFKIKKGTPYYFNAGNYIDTGNFDLAFNYTHKAIEDDKIRGSLQNSSYDYHNSPAFLFASLNVDKTNNFLWGKVRSLVIRLEQYIKRYNFIYNSNLNFQTIKNKFLSQNHLFENEITYFVYLLAALTYENYLIITLGIFNNNFARMRNLDHIFSFCLLLDKIMAKKTNEEYISGSAYKLIEKLLNLPLADSDKQIIKTKLKWAKNNPGLIIEAIKFMIDRNKKLFPYNSNYNRKINKKIINTMLIYFLRNRSAHDVKLEYLNTQLYDKILQALFFELFIIIEDLL